MKQRQKIATLLFAFLLLLFAASCNQPDAAPAEERNELIEQIREIQSLSIPPDSMHILLNTLWAENEHRITENEKISFYNTRANIYTVAQELELAEANFLKALYYIEKLNDEILGRQAQIMMNIGNTRFRQAKFDEALDIYRQALTFLENNPDYTEIVSLITLNKVMVFMLRDETDSALYYAQRLLDIATAEGFRLMEALALSHIALVFFSLEQFAQAKENFQAAIPILIEYNNLPQLWNTYLNFAAVLFALNRMEEGLIYAQKSNELAATLGLPLVGMVRYYGRRGLIYKEEGNLQSSLAMLYQASELQNKLPDLRIIATLQNQIGEVHIKMGNLTAAYYYLSAARHTAQEHRLLRVEADAQKFLAIIYAMRSDMDSSLTATITERELRQQITNKHTVRALQEMQIRYETEINQLLIAQKTEEIRYTQRQNLFLSIILVLVLVVLILTIIFHRRKVQNIHHIVKQHEAYLKYKQEAAQQQPDTSQPVEEESPSKKLALAIQHLFETEKIYCQQGLSINEVATKLETGHKYLSNAIREHFQKGFVDYVNTYRVEEAIELLKEQKQGGKYARYSVEAIAEEAGFGNRATFYAVFKRIIGVTPREYMDIINQK